MMEIILEMEREAITQTRWPCRIFVPYHIHHLALEAESCDGLSFLLQSRREAPPQAFLVLSPPHLSVEGVGLSVENDK